MVYEGGRRSHRLAGTGHTREWRLSTCTKPLPSQELRHRHMKPRASTSHLARAAESSLRISPPRAWYRELREIGLALLVTFAYFLTRGLARGSVGDAIHHA